MRWRFLCVLSECVCCVLAVETKPTWTVQWAMWGFDKLFNNWHHDLLLRLCKTIVFTLTEPFPTMLGVKCEWNLNLSDVFCVDMGALWRHDPHWCGSSGRSVTFAAKRCHLAVNNITTALVWMINDNRNTAIQHHSGHDYSLGCHLLKHKNRSFELTAEPCRKSVLGLVCYISQWEIKYLL